MGDGVARSVEGGVARLTPLASRAEELRDRWRLSGAAHREEADASFVWDAGARASASLVEGPAAVVTPSAKTAARAEKARGGAGDPLPVYLGAAHGPAWGARPGGTGGRARRASASERGRLP